MIRERSRPLLGSPGAARRDHCDGLPDGKGTLGGIDFSATVLTTGYWPSYQAPGRPRPPDARTRARVRARARREKD